MTCPKCRAEKDGYNSAGNKRYKCFTWFDKEGNLLSERTPECYERELALKDALLERAKIFIERHTQVKYCLGIYMPGIEDCVCEYCHYREKAQALLAEMEEK